MERIRAKQGFLVPVKVLSKVYRARFCDQLQKKIDNQALELPEGTDPKVLRESLFKKDWVVYAKKTGKSVDHALEYLARYTNLTTGLHHLNYSMQNVYFTDVLLLGTLWLVRDCGAANLSTDENLASESCT